MRPEPFGNNHHTSTVARCDGGNCGVVRGDDRTLVALSNLDIAEGLQEKPRRSWKAPEQRKLWSAMCYANQTCPHPIYTIINFATLSFGDVVAFGRLLG
jgi:hypothetical protein